MPQNPLAATIAVNTSNQQAPAKLDVNGDLRTNGIPSLTALDLIANTVVKAGPGRVGTINIISAPGSAGGVYDCLTTAAAATSNQMAVIPALTTSQVSTLGVIPAIQVNMMAQVGITVLTTGQIAISYE